MTLTHATVRSPDGLDIHYEAGGSGEPALVFVHGLGCKRQHWEAQLEAFAPRHAVVAIDLAGHGESGRARGAWSMPAFADDVAAVVRALNLKRIILVGHSMGGSVIVHAARKLAPAVIGLVGVDTWSALEQGAGIPGLSPAAAEDRLAPFRKDFKRSMDAWVRTMFMPTSDPAMVEQVVATMSSAPPELVLDMLGGRLDTREGFKKVFGEVGVPIHAIATDEFMPRSMETARRHGFKLVKMTGVGHFLMMEDAAAFNRHLETAIAEIVAAGTGG